MKHSLKKFNVFFKEYKEVITLCKSEKFVNILYMLHIYEQISVTIERGGRTRLEKFNIKNDYTIVLRAVK